mmetsp:Transcript_48361/g.104784  ORF Transcript_48361/g.104784 Transcript_48361/m.104784 type:complete len:258 (-) Transcript_48361:300-1073(-)
MHEGMINMRMTNEPPKRIFLVLVCTLRCMRSSFSSSSSMTCKSAGLYCFSAGVPYAPRACSAMAETPPPAMARDPLRAAIDCATDLFIRLDPNERLSKSKTRVSTTPPLKSKSWICSNVSLCRPATTVTAPSMGTAVKGEQKPQSSSMYRASRATASRMRVRPRVDSCVLSAPSVRWIACDAKTTMSRTQCREKNSDGTKSMPISDETEATFATLSPNNDTLDVLRSPKIRTMRLPRGRCFFLRAFSQCVLQRAIQR